jgi:hypothetical protein
MGEQEKIRQNAIARNELFISSLGIQRPEPTILENQKKRKQSDFNQSSTSKRSSQRLQNATKIILETAKAQLNFHCNMCNSSKLFKNKKALHVHQSCYCISIVGYIPNDLRTQQFEKFLLEECIEVKKKSMATNAMISGGASVLSSNMPLFNVQDVEDTENDVEDTDDDIPDYISNNDISDELDSQEGQPNCIRNFQILQESFCNSVFGEHYFDCQNLQQLKDLLKRRDSDLLERQRRNQLVYNFIVEKGLSREDGNDLLKLIQSFKPMDKVPKSFQAIEKSARVDAASLFQYREISVPWVESWQMDKLPEYQPVKIYCRDLFQIISQMLVDPEIMLVWKKHVYMNYWRAVDKDGQHVFSHVMTSKWCEETEKLVKDKDPQGVLLPLIFYTDGVQVSSNVRNKITPVMVTLGNFSDELLQKHFSKRIIAYIPNLKGISKDNLKTHLMRTLGISKTAVIFYLIQYSLTELLFILLGDGCFIEV